MYESYTPIILLGRRGIGKKPLHKGSVISNISSAVIIPTTNKFIFMCVAQSDLYDFVSGMFLRNTNVDTNYQKLFKERVQKSLKILNW